MKKSLLVFSVFIIAALLLVKILHKNQADYFLWTGKIYSRSDFYDRCKEITDKWTTDDSLKNAIGKGVAENSNVLFLRADSYRNEDLYVFEIKIAFRDSESVNHIDEILQSRLKQDAVLDKRYFQRLNFQQSLIALADTADRKNISTNDLLLREYVKYQTQNTFEELQRRLSYSFPAEGMTRIRTDNSRIYLMAVVLSLLAAFGFIILTKKKTITS